MNDWNEQNFLERLMPRLQGHKPALREPCPDAESLCAFAEDRLSGGARNAIAEHLKYCAECRDINGRLLDFARPPVLVEPAEWTGAEKRLGNWMDGVLRVAGSHGSAAAHPEARRPVGWWNWLASPKLTWALGAFAAVAVLAAIVVFHMRSPGEQGLPSLANRTAPAAQTEQTSPPLAQPETTATVHETTKPARQPGGPPVSNHESAPAVATNAPPPAPTTAPNASPRSFTPPAAAPAASPPSPVLPNSTAKAFAVAITPETKQELADEVRARLVTVRGVAINPQLASPTGGDVLPDALNPTERLFIVASTLNEALSDGEECSLTQGDLITRISDTPDVNQNVQVLVSSSQRNDCSAGTQLAVAVQDLQDMYNEFQLRMDAGLQKLAENQGQNGLPAGPAAGRTANPDGTANVDLTAYADLQQQQQDATSTEQEIEQTANEAYSPSSFHPDETSESGRLSLIAWSQNKQAPAPAPHAQPSAPARPAPPPAQHAPAPTPAQHPQPAQHPAQPPRPASPPARPATGGVKSATPGAKPSVGGNKGAPSTAKPDAATHGARPNTNRPAATTHAPAAKPAPGRPAARSAPVHNPNGTTTMTRPNGSSVTLGRNGKPSSVRTASGATAKFNSAGKLSSVHASVVHAANPMHSGEMTIRHGAHGEKTIVTSRHDGSRVVSTGAHRGYVEHTFTRGGRPYLRRTYVAGGRRDAYVYRGYPYRGVVYYGYVPAFYFAPAFYGWAYNPWGAPVAWGWGWGGAPWYGYYEYYFAPYPAYESPAFWLTDYVLAEYLQAAYDAQVNASAQAAPVPRAPQRGVYAAYRTPEIDAAITHRSRWRSSRRMESSKI
jgi:hypothetical protein